MWPTLFLRSSVSISCFGQSGSSVQRLDCWRSAELATGERAVVGSVDFMPATGAIQIQGLVLSHVMESGETSPIVAVESIGLRLGLPFDGAVVRRLDIERPVISLHVDDDGLRGFER